MFIFFSKVLPPFLMPLGASLEGLVVALILLRRGRRRAALALETRSRNTYENAAESATIACARGLRRLLLVTSASHMPRAAALFRRQAGRCGLSILPAPTGAIAPTQHVYGVSRFLPSA